MGYFENSTNCPFFDAKHRVISMRTHQKTTNDTSKRETRKSCPHCAQQSKTTDARPATMENDAQFQAHASQTPQNAACDAHDTCDRENDDAPQCRYHHEKMRSDAELKPLIHRLNRIEGQIRGVRNMLQNNAYCPDILTQSGAAVAALQAFNRELLAQHIHTCVVHDIQSGNEQIVDELCNMLQKLMK